MGCNLPWGFMINVAGIVMSIAKIRVKLGSLELDYEGDPNFLSDGLTDLLEKVANLSSQIPTFEAQAPDERPAVNPSDQTPTVQPVIKLTTASIGARMRPKSGPELAICAMAHLELVKGLQTYDKKELLAQMKNAPSFYKQSMSSNHSQNMGALVKSKRVNEVGAGKLCLDAAERQKVEAALA